MHRIRAILESTSTLESKRLIPALIRGSFVLVLLVPMLLTGFQVSRGFPGSHVLQIMFYMISLLGLVFLAGYVTFESVGSRQSSFISLVALTGISQEKWCLARVGEMWRTFLLIWVVRLPILAWLQIQGGLNWSEVCSLELLLLFLFGWLSSLGLLIGSGKLTKGVTFGVVCFGFVAWEFICNLGLLVTAITSFYGLQLIHGVDGFTQLLIHFSVFRKVLSLNSGGFNGHYFVWQAAILLIFTGFCLWRFSQKIFENIGANSLGTDRETVAASPIKNKKMPRCWSNALAWQAFYYHHNGMKTLYGRILAYIAVIVAVTAMNYFKGSITEYGSFLFAATGLVLGPMMAANVSLAKEVKEQTLPSLTMACGDPIKIYQGWQQSWRRMAIPDILLLPALLFSISWSAPMTAFYAGTGIIGIACIGPLLFFSVFLAAWTWPNVITSAKIFLAIVVIAGLGILIGWAMNWLLLPVVVIPLLFALGQWILYRDLPKFFDPLVSPRK